MHRMRCASRSILRVLLLGIALLMLLLVSACLVLLIPAGCQLLMLAGLLLLVVVLLVLVLLGLGRCHCIPSSLSIHARHKPGRAQQAR